MFSFLCYFLCFAYYEMKITNQIQDKFRMCTKLYLPPKSIYVKRPLMVFKYFCETDEKKFPTKVSQYSVDNKLKIKSKN